MMRLKIWDGFKQPIFSKKGNYKDIDRCLEGLRKDLRKKFEGGDD